MLSLTPNGAMPNVQVKNVPPEFHESPRDRASEDHHSLLEFILETRLRSAALLSDTEIFKRLRADMCAACEDRPPIPLTRRPHLWLIPRIWELRDHLTAYDAAYVSLAEALRCPLVASDARLASAAGIRCEVEVIGT